MLFVCDYGTIASPLSKITMGSILSKKGVLQNFKLNSAATVNIADLKRKLKAADLVVPIYSHNQKVMSGVLKDLKIKREVLTLDPKDVLVNEAVFNKVLINLLKKKKTS